LNYARANKNRKNTKIKNVIKYFMPIASAAAIMLVVFLSNDKVAVKENAKKIVKTQYIEKTLDKSYNIELGDKTLDAEMMELSLEIIFEQNDLEGTDVTPNNSSSDQRVVDDKYIG